MLKKVLIIVGFFVVLYCIRLLVAVTSTYSEVSDMENMVLQNLNDPESAQFKAPSFSDDKELACLPWNAKNGWGGYESWKVAYRSVSTYFSPEPLI